MRNIAASDYFRRMKEEHARKEVERQESRARQVQHDLVLAREQVRGIPVPTGQQSNVSMTKGSCMFPVGIVAAKH